MAADILFVSRLPDGDVQTALLALVLHVATACQVHVVDGLEEQLLEFHVVGEVLFGLVETNVSDVDGGTVLVARVLRCIHIAATTQTFDVVLRAVDAGDDEAVTAVVAAVV